VRHAASYANAKSPALPLPTSTPALPGLPLPLLLLLLLLLPLSEERAGWPCAAAAAVAAATAAVSSGGAVARSNHAPTAPQRSFRLKSHRALASWSSMMARRSSMHSWNMCFT
jgi:hypothetical protein